MQSRASIDFYKATDREGSDEATDASVGRFIVLNYFVYKLTPSNFLGHGHGKDGLSKSFE